MWDVKDSNIYYTVILMLIYTGCRIGELLDLKKEDVNLEDRYFKIIASKTAAGIRTPPIAEKVYPLFEYWYTLNDCEYLLSTPDGEHFKYRNYYDSYWMPLIDALGMQIAEKNREMISGITGNMHDGYDIIFKDGHSCHCRTKKDVRSCIIEYCNEKGD